jgi:small GTP-binding protein
MESEAVKIVVLGMDGVGKSSLIQRFANKIFPECCDPHPSESHECTIEMYRETISLKIYDTVNDRDYYPMLVWWIREADGFLIVFSNDCPDSLDEAEGLYKELCKTKRRSDSAIVIVGNKSDMPDRKVQARDGDALAARLGGQFVETSAKTGHNVPEAFQMLVGTIWSRQLAARTPAPETYPPMVTCCVVV